MGSKKPYLVAIMTQIFLAGMSLVSKAAFASGMNTFVFVFYRQAAGAVFFLPLIFFFKRQFFFSFYSIIHSIFSFLFLLIINYLFSSSSLFCQKTESIAFSQGFLEDFCDFVNRVLFLFFMSNGIINIQKYAFYFNFF